MFGMLGMFNQSLGVSSSSATFNPIQLFSASEQGAFYNLGDTSTLFQDSTGSTPVTAVEQPVGLVLDKSKGLAIGSNVVTNGTFATDTSWTKGTNWTISSGAANCNNPVAGGYNALSQNMGLVQGTTYILTFDITITSGQLIDIRAGGSTAGFAVASNITTSGSKIYYITPTGTNGTLYFYADSAGFVGSIDNVVVRSIAGNHATQSTAAKRPVLSARYNLLLATETLSTQNVTTVAADYTLAFGGAGTITLSGTSSGVKSAGSNTITCTAGTLTLTVSGSVTQADLRLTNDGVNLPSYQRVAAATDYDTTGFPLYLKFDGVDDALQTGSIDFSATDKMTVFGGVRKLSDAAQGAISELSATIASNNGTFLLTAPNSAAANYNFSSKGTTQVDNTVTTYTSPISGVLTGQGDISAPSNTVRVNGTQVGYSTSSQGTGNYGNYALNVGSRNAASLYFNGRLYSLIIRGATTTSEEITQTETWINQQAKIY